jgi:hypothetical protein
MKRGRAKHLLDALVGRFNGYPNGLLASSVDVPALLAFRGRAYRVDLLAGVLDPSPPAVAAAAPMLVFLDGLAAWLRDWVEKEGGSLGEVDLAEIEFEIGEPAAVDLSVQATYRNGEFWRDPGGQAHVERIKTTQVVPEWRAVPRVPIDLRFRIRANGLVFAKDELGGALQFMPERA